ncbi:PAS domain S-box protein [Spirulina subsalsa]|uniref:PAS domain S-box protein n=1 Tax=Spirulina subsalsa TaxID=54311 RepID=UPI0002D3CC74|nr:PAS domain S-box protein [Spirulina subsalsa]
MSSSQVWNVLILGRDPQFIQSLTLALQYFRESQSAAKPSLGKQEKSRRKPSIFSRGCLSSTNLKTLYGHKFQAVVLYSVPDVVERLQEDANGFALWIDYTGITPQDSLNLIRHIRKDIHNPFLRIVLYVREKDLAALPINWLCRYDVSDLFYGEDLVSEKIHIRCQEHFRVYHEKVTTFNFYRVKVQLEKTISYLRLILEKIPQQVFWKDASSRFLGCNTKWATAAGFDNPEAVVGLSDEDIIPDPEVAKLFRQEDQKIIEQKQPKLHSIATKYREGVQGKKVWLDISKIPLYDSEGQPLGIVGVLEDITERKNAEEALERSLSLLRAIFESIADGVLAVDRMGEIISYNKKFLEMWKLQEGDFTLPNPRQRTFKLADQLEDPQGFITRVIEIYSQPEVHSYDVLVFKDGRILERYSQPQRLGDLIVGRVWNFRDITLAKQSEVALQQQMRRAVLLGEITQRIRSSLDPKEIFQITVNQVGQAFEVSRCNLRLYVPGDPPQLRQVAEYVEGGYSCSEAMIAIADYGYVEAALREDRAIASDQISLPGLFPPDTQSLLSVRTSYQGAPNGLITLQQCAHPRSWTPDEMELLEAVAAQVGIAIAHAQLLQQEKHQRAKLDRQNQQLQQQIKQRRQMEAELRHSERQLRAITASVPGMVFEAISQGSEHHQWTFISDGVQELYGITPQEALETSALWERIAPEDRETLLNAIAYSQNHLTPYDLFTRIYPHHGGEKWVRSLAQPKQLPNGSILWTGVQVDVTESKQQELALIQAREAADTANRAKSAFLANMSHELRTPLNAILGFTQLLSRISQLKPEQQEYLSIINRSGEHLLTLINDVLEMSKIEAGRVMFHEDHFDLYRLLDSLEDLMQIKAQTKGLQLQFQRDDNLPQYIHTDESKLRQVLLNLLSNGLKFTESGQVALTTTRLTNHPPILKFTVQDTGLGISPEELTLLFSPFGQTESGRKSQQGTGLGLAISRQFVQLLGGELTVQSQLGQGSTFSFQIPVRLGSPLPSPSSNPPRQVIHLAPQQPPYRILVVEDRLESRQLLVTLLQKLGFQLQAAENGQEAIHCWQTWHPHLIWMDIRMPILDGLEATKQIRRLEENHPHHTVIIAVTASAFEEQRAEVLAAGCDDFVRKPFQESMLLDKMAQYLGVQYIYASSEEVTQITNPRAGASVPTLETIQADLLTLDRAWVEELHLAAMQCSVEQLLPILAKLSPTYYNLAEGLKQWGNNFEFETIVNLTQQVLDTP